MKNIIPRMRMYVLMVLGFGFIFGCGGNDSMYGTTDGGTTRYSCSGSLCVTNIYGSFTTATCDNACGGGGDGTGGVAGCTVTGATMTTSVSIQDFYFTPSCIKVNASQTVTWIHNGTYPHTVTSNPGVPVAFDSGTLTSGSQFLFTFTATGTYGYYCSNHQLNDMTGTVIVQ